jgi:hypothetical protein
VDGLFAQRIYHRGSLVPEPIIAMISHALGRDEAKHRLDNGLGYIREQLAAFVSSTHYGRRDTGSISALQRCSKTL